MDRLLAYAQDVKNIGEPEVVQVNLDTLEGRQLVMTTTTQRISFAVQTDEKDRPVKPGTTERRISTRPGVTVFGAISCSMWCLPPATVTPPQVGGSSQPSECAPTGCQPTVTGCGPGLCGPNCHFVGCHRSSGGCYLGVIAQ